MKNINKKKKNRWWSSKIRQKVSSKAVPYNQYIVEIIQQRYDKNKLLQMDNVNQHIKKCCLWMIAIPTLLVIAGIRAIVHLDIKCLAPNVVYQATIICRSVLDTEATTGLWK